MKISIQLRQFGKNEAKVYFRLRDGMKDMKVASSLRILPEFWDSVNYRYKKTTPIDIVSEEVQKDFNDKISIVLRTLNEQYTEGKDFLWFATTVNSIEDLVRPESTNQEPVRKVQKPTGKKDKTMLEYFQIYMDTSNFNDWHYQAQIAVMRKVARFESWLQFKEGNKDLKLYLPFFDKQGTQSYLEYIEQEWELREQCPEHFAQFELYADYNIRPMSKNTLSCSAKRLFMFLNWCVTNGFMECKDYNNVTIDQQVYGTPYYLTMEERDKVMNTDFSFDSRLDFHRDKFIFQCLIGCRANDLERLTWDNLVNGFIEYIPHKNLLNGKTDLVRCPLCDKAKDILDRLDPTMPYLFVRYSHDVYREDIKKILKIAGIDRIVTILDPKTRQPVQKPLYEVAATHLARRTFIGNLYKQVPDPALISSLTGHSEHSKSFERYRAIDDDMKRDILKFIQ